MSARIGLDLKALLAGKRPASKVGTMLILIKMNAVYISLLIFVGISMVPTLLAGLLPARRASKSDPVRALRSE